MSSNYDSSSSFRQSVRYGNSRSPVSISPNNAYGERRLDSIRRSPQSAYQTPRQTFSPDRNPRTNRGSPQEYMIEPTFMESAPLVLAPKFEIQPWFSTLMKGRSFFAAGIAALISSTLFLPLVAFRIFKILSPFQSVLDAVYLPLSLSFWLPCALVGCGVFIFCQAVNRMCFNPLYETNHNITKGEPLLAVVAECVLTFFIWICLSMASDISLFGISSPTGVFFCLLSGMSAYETAFLTNFGWDFVDCTPLEFVYSIYKALVIDTATSVARNALYAYGSSLVLCTFFAFTRANYFILITDPGCIVDHVLLVFVVTLISRLTFDLLNAVVMQPIDLPLPVSGFITDETARSQKSLLNAISSKDLLLKTFGFRALVELSCAEETCAAVFALSQPSGRPKNWQRIRDSCVDAIAYVEELLQCKCGRLGTDVRYERKTKFTELGPAVRSAATPTIRPLAQHGPFGGAFDIGNVDENGVPKYALSSPSKARLLLPPNLNPRRYDVQKPKSDFPWELDLTKVPYLSDVAIYIRNNYVQPAPAIPTYYLTQAEYSLRALSVLMARSIEEDQYGIVQNDLSTLFSTFLQLDLHIDLYIRSTSNSREDVAVRPNLQRLEGSLFDALQRVFEVFRPHIDAMDLTEAERQLLDVLTEKWQA